MSVLKVENLLQSFGGVEVLRNVSFSLEAGERVALIGPNGAGKTTLLNVLSGLLPSRAGRVYLLGHEITNMPAHKRVSLGIARSFQINTLFPGLTLVTNVLLALQGKKSVRFSMLRPISAYTDTFAEAQALLETMGLWEKRDTRVSVFSHGEQRRLEVLLALASKPKLLLMDEPTAGLTSGEAAELVNIIRSLVGDTTTLFCSHDMELVFALGDRVIVLYYGGIIAQGTPREIQTDPKVREIYLGV